MREPMANVRSAEPALGEASSYAAAMTVGTRSRLRVVSVEAASSSPRVQAVTLVRAMIANRLFLM
jgi:hypothetical protein